MTSQSSHYRGCERSSRRLAYLNLATAIAYTAIWLVGVAIWVACAWMNIDTARTWSESADMYERIEAGTYWPVQR